MRLSSLLVVIVGFFSLFFSSTALAVNANSDPLGLEYGQLTNLSDQDPRYTIANIINIALSLLGIIFLVLLIYAGFLWMTAAGNEDNVEKARKLIFAAIIGLAIILSAFAISKFVTKALYEASQGVEYGTLK